MYKYVVLKLEDIESYLTPNYRKLLKRMANRISRGRAADGKPGVNDYYVVNRTESWADDVRDVMAQNIAGPIL